LWPLLPKTKTFSRYQETLRSAQPILLPALRPNRDSRSDDYLWVGYTTRLGAAIQSVLGDIIGQDTRGLGKRIDTRQIHIGKSQLQLLVPLINAISIPLLVAELDLSIA